MSLPHTMRALLEVRPARVLALGKVLRGEGKGLCVCACMHVCALASAVGSARPPPKSGGTSGAAAGLLYQPRSRGGATGPRFAPGAFWPRSNRGWRAPRGATRGARRARVRVRAQPSRMPYAVCRLPSAVCRLPSAVGRRPPAAAAGRRRALAFCATRSVDARRPAPDVPEPVRRARGGPAPVNRQLPPTRSNIFFRLVVTVWAREKFLWRV